MRQEFSRLLYEIMQQDDRIWLVTADLGFGMWDKIRDEFPDRFLNTGASEMAAADICVGLALSDKKPLFYSITPFLLYRCFEVWRTYINHEKIPVIGVGSGRDKDYAHDGFSHEATDDKIWMKNFENIVSVWPVSVPAMKKWLKIALDDNNPYYINLKR